MSTPLVLDAQNRRRARHRRAEPSIVEEWIASARATFATPILVGAFVGGLITYGLIVLIEIALGG